MSTPLWRQVIEGTFDPFSSSFDRRSSAGTGFAELDTDWRAFQIGEADARTAEQEASRLERESLELQGQEYVNLSQRQAALESALSTAEAFGQPNVNPAGPTPALESIANVLDAAKSGVVGALSGLMGWDIQGEDSDSKIGTSRFRREEDLVGDRNRMEVAWRRALQGLLGGQSYGFGDFAALRYEQDDPRIQRVAMGTAAFVLDVAFDPLTYASFGSSIFGRIVASTGVRQASRMLGKEVLENAGNAVVRSEAEKLGVRELSQRITDITGRNFDDQLLRSSTQLVDDLATASPSGLFDAALDSWSLGNAAAYGSGGRTKLYDRLVDTIGQDATNGFWSQLPGDIRGGLRIRVPFSRTTDEVTGLRLPTTFQFPFSQPGRGFDLLGMGTVTRRMNEARLVARTGPFRFLENVTGNRGRTWTAVLQAARKGDAEAVEAYAIHFGLMSLDDSYRLMAANYDRIPTSGMQAIGREISAANESGYNPEAILDFVEQFYYMRGRPDQPIPASPEDIVGKSIAERLMEMTDSVHKILVDIYGEDAARKAQDYATRMLTEDGFTELADRYGRLQGKRGRIVDGTGRLNSSFPRTMEMNKDGKLIVTSWMTPGEITGATGRELFISDPIEAVGEYLMMVRREVMRDWTLKQLNDMGLLKTIGGDVIRQPTIAKIQSEVETRMFNLRKMMESLKRGEVIPEFEADRLIAERAGIETIRRSGNLVEVDPGVWRSSDGLVEIRTNRSGGVSATVSGQPVLRPIVSQAQAEGLLPPGEVSANRRTVDWDEVRNGFYDSRGERIPARSVRMEGTDDPLWVTTSNPDPARPDTRGRRSTPRVEEPREVSGTWSSWLETGSDENLQYVHKILKQRIAVHEAGGKSVNRRAYQIHKRDLDILEEQYPWLRGMQYDNSPIPSSSVLPDSNFELRLNSRTGAYEIVDRRSAPLDAARTIKRIVGDQVQMSDGSLYAIKFRSISPLPVPPNRWVAENVADSSDIPVHGKTKKEVKERITNRFKTPEAVDPATGPAAPGVRRDIPTRVRTREEILEEIGDLELSWSKVGRNHVAYYDDFEIIISTAPKDSQSKYVIKVIAPDGKSYSSTSHSNLANSKGLVVRFYLSPEMERFGLRTRERAIREAIGDSGTWPGLSVVDNSFTEYSSTTRVATVDFGDNSSLELVWNGNTWVASRDVNGRGIGDPPIPSVSFEHSDWESFVEALDELYPGISRVLDDQLPGRPVGGPGGVVAFDARPAPAAAQTVGVPGVVSGMSPQQVDRALRDVLFPVQDLPWVTQGDLDSLDFFGYRIEKSIIKRPRDRFGSNTYEIRIISPEGDVIGTNTWMTDNVTARSMSIDDFLNALEKQPVEDVIGFLTAGRAETPTSAIQDTPNLQRIGIGPQEEPVPIVPGLQRIMAGQSRYVSQTGETFDVNQTRVDGKRQIWRITNNQGDELGDFATQKEAVAFLEGRAPEPPKPPVAPEVLALQGQARSAIREVESIIEEIEGLNAILEEGFRAGNPVEILASDISDLFSRYGNAYDFVANSLEILAFDNPDMARRMLSQFNELGPDLRQLLSNAIEDVAARAPRQAASLQDQLFGSQQSLSVTEGFDGIPTLSPSARIDFADRDEAAFWANRIADKIREPQARVVRDEVWESNRAGLIEKMETDYQWLEAALEIDNVIRMEGEQFDTWVDRVIVFLDGVDPSIDPYDEVFDKTRYTLAARDAGLSRMSDRTAGFDPVMEKLIRDQDLFGVDMLAESIKRHFSLSKDVDGAEGFYQNFWRPYYTASKSWLTQGRGYGYTSRNIIGSMYNAWIADVRARHFRQSAALLASRRSARERADEIVERRGVQEGESTVDAWERIFDSELRKNLREGVNGFAGMRDDIANLVADSYRAFTERNYGGRTARSRTWGDILDRGTFDSPVYGPGGTGRQQAELFPGRTVEELNRAQRIANATIDNPWMRHVTRVNETSEDYLRFAAFLRGVETYGLDDGGLGAGTWVIGTQFDYASLSDFERRVMKNIIPFYTWTRYNVPLQIRSVWMEPGKVARLLRFHEEVVKAWTGEADEQEEVLPEWLRRRGGWMTTMNAPRTDPETLLGRVFGLKEDPIAAFIESPLTDLGMLFNATMNPMQLLNADEVINNLNPILGRTAFETVTGRSYVSGRELDTDAVAPRWAAPYAFVRGRRNEEGELLFSQKWANFYRNVAPPFAQIERLAAPLLGDERMRRRWLTTVGSQLLATPLYTVDPNQQAFALGRYAEGVHEALRSGIINYDDKRDVVRRLLDQGYDSERIGRLGLGDEDMLEVQALNFDELSRARRNVATENEISRFLETLPEDVAEIFIFRRGFRGKTGIEAVEAWKERKPIDELGSLYLPEINSAFASWFSRMSESDRLGFVFRYGYGPYRGVEAVQRWQSEGGLPNRPPGLGSADFLS